jgi:transcription elongation factor Elf1
MEYGDRLICENCGNQMDTSQYQVPAEIKKTNNRIKFAHMECCSAEELKQNLLSQAQTQIRFYKDVIDLVNNTSLEKIRDMEIKYGTYDEVSQGIQTDREIMTSALI